MYPSPIPSLFLLKLHLLFIIILLLLLPPLRTTLAVTIFFDHSAACESISSTGPSADIPLDPCSSIGNASSASSMMIPPCPVDQTINACGYKDSDCSELVAENGAGVSWSSVTFNGQNYACYSESVVPYTYSKVHCGNGLLDCADFPNASGGSAAQSTSTVEVTSTVAWFTGGGDSIVGGNGASAQTFATAGSSMTALTTTTSTSPGPQGSETATAAAGGSDGGGGTSSGFSTSDSIAIGVGLGVGVPAIAIGLWQLRVAQSARDIMAYRHRHRR